MTKYIHWGIGVLGLLLVGFSSFIVLVFAGAASSVSVAKTNEFMQYFMPICALVFVIYNVAAIFLLGKKRYVAAQILIWLPILIFCTQNILKMGR
jgi:hypothetical protein